MSYYLIRTIEALITPPGLMFVMIFSGFMVGSHFARLGRNLILSGLVLLLLASLPVTSHVVYSLLEADPPLSQQALADTQAKVIVILGGGRYPGFEFQKETVSNPALERLRYGAWLHRQTDLPILVTGGSVKGETTSEARLMAQTLAASLGARAKWVEEQSRNTWENARFSWQLLKKSQTKHILLVTHAAHMTRSKIAFTRQGFTVTPAPMGFKSRAPLGPLHFLPSAHAMSSLQSAFHEWIGRLWYSINY